MLYALSGIILAVVAGTGCEKEVPRVEQEGPLNANTVIATVDDATITLGEVLRELESLTIPGRDKSSTPENAYNEVLYRKLAFAKVEEFDDYDPKEIHRLAKNRLHDVAMQYMAWDKISRHVVVSESSIDSFYRENISTYTIPARRRVTHLLISDNLKAWEAAGIDVSGWTPEDVKAHEQEYIERFYAEVKGGADIAELAAQHSHDTNSKQRRGDSGWFTREEMVDEFSAAAFTLPIGGLSKPFKSIYGWHILRVDSASAEFVAPLDSNLRAQIDQQLKMQVEAAIAQHFVDSVYVLAQYQWNDAILERNVGDYDPHEWVCIVNGTDTIEAGILREYEMMYRTSARVSDMTPELRKSLLQAKASPFVLASVCRQLGYFDLDTLKTAYQNLRRSEIISRITRRRIPPETNYSDEVLKAYYRAHESEFNSDKPIQIQQIIFSDSMKAVEALREVRAGVDFKDVAMKYYPGEQDFKEAAFELGWIARDDVDANLYDRAWLTPLNEVSGPVRTQWGFHLIRVLDRKMQLDFEGARNEVRRRKRAEDYEKQENDWVEWLKKGRTIVRYDDIWSQIDFANPARYFQVADSLSSLKQVSGS